LYRHPEENIPREKFVHASDSFFPTPVPSKNMEKGITGTQPGEAPDSIEISPLQNVEAEPRTHKNRKDSARPPCPQEEAPVDSLDSTAMPGTYETDLRDAYPKKATEDQNLLKELSKPQNDDYLGAIDIERYHSLCVTVSTTRHSRSLMT
jgi:hypothetical protein